MSGRHAVPSALLYCGVVSVMSFTGINNIIFGVGVFLLFLSLLSYEFFGTRYSTAILFFASLFLLSLSFFLSMSTNQFSLFLYFHQCKLCCKFRVRIRSGRVGQSPEATSS